jgi:hypothetical protein
MKQFLCMKLAETIVNSFRVTLMEHFRNYEATVIHHYEEFALFKSQKCNTSNYL